MAVGWVDIHCHLLPGIDDGAADLATSLAMARLAAADGARTIIATPHQLGAYGHNRGATIRRAAADLGRQIAHAGVPLEVLPGADVRIEDGMIEKLADGDVLTLADRGKHVLLELPHDVYFPLERLVEQLRRRGVTAILSHPERNQGLLRQPALLPRLVDAGCLMQITAGSLTGGMGKAPRGLAEAMLKSGLVHFVASDAHGIRARRPRLSGAYQRVLELVDAATAEALCHLNPAAVADGRDVALGRRPMAPRGWRRFFRASSSKPLPGRKAA